MLTDVPGTFEKSLHDPRWNFVLLCGAGFRIQIHFPFSLTRLSRPLAQTTNLMCLWADAWLLCHASVTDMLKGMSAPSRQQRTLVQGLALTSPCCCGPWDGVLVELGVWGAWGGWGRGMREVFQGRGRTSGTVGGEWKTVSGPGSNARSLPCYQAVQTAWICATNLLIRKEN